MPESKKTLILCIDRDDDLGDKAKIKGPVIGEKKCLEAANTLIMKDPEDSDANSMFAAVKAKKSLPNSEVAIITGDMDVGIKSDRELARQLRIVIGKVKPKEAVIVSDGAEDEHIIPVVQSFLPVVSVQRVVIRQSQNLESSYYMIKEFIQEVVRDPKLARIFLGLPAMALIILAVFGSTGWRLVIGASGLYLLVRGLQLELLVSKIAAELMNSLKKDRVSFFFYMLSLIFGAVAIAYGYEKVLMYGIDNWLLSAFAFVNGSVLIFFVAGLFAWMGKTLMYFMGRTSDAKLKENVWHSTTIFSLFFALTIAAFTATEFLLKPEIGVANLMFSILLGFAAIILSVLVERSQKRK